MCRAIDVAALEPVIDRVFPFEEARDAYRYNPSVKPFGTVVIAHG